VSRSGELENNKFTEHVARERLDPFSVNTVTDGQGVVVQSYSYDANGNMTGGAGRSIIYDFENRAIQITKMGVTTDFVYDGDGGRVSKTVGGTTTTYIGKHYLCENGACKRLIFSGDLRIAEVDSTSGDPIYFHTDHLGSTGVVTDKLGNNIEDITYYPYGLSYSDTGTENVRYKFTGQELDFSTDLYFYNARYYDPSLARFISADSIVPDPLDPQSFNRYSYVRNNPINLTDPTGHSFFSSILKSFIANIVGGPGWGWLVFSGESTNWNVEAMAIQQSIAALSVFTGGSAGVAIGGFEGALVGAAVGSIVSSAAYDLAGYDVNYGESLLTSLVVSAISYGIAPGVEGQFNWQAKGVSTILSAVAAEVTGGDFFDSLGASLSTFHIGTGVSLYVNEIFAETIKIRQETRRGNRHSELVRKGLKPDLEAQNHISRESLGGRVYLIPDMGGLDTNTQYEAYIEAGNLRASKNIDSGKVSTEIGGPAARATVGLSIKIEPPPASHIVASPYILALGTNITYNPQTGVYGVQGVNLDFSLGFNRFPFGVNFPTDQISK